MQKEAEAVRSGAASQSEEIIEATYEVKEESKESKDKK